MALDLGLLAEKLKEAGFEEVVVQGPHLTILVDDIGVVAQVYQSGTIHLQATLRDDVEIACDLIYAVALTENAKQAKKTDECHFE
jgi:aromatic ring-opening dioxygenase LigB subunit